jgi:hypothetical protein
MAQKWRFSHRGVFEVVVVAVRIGERRGAVAATHLDVQLPLRETNRTGPILLLSAFPHVCLSRACLGKLSVLHS